MYDHRWRAVSKRVRAESPRCSWCGAAAGEAYTDAKARPRSVLLTVDHIRPLSSGGTDDRVNLRVLCNRCHGLRTDEKRWRI